MCLGTTVARRRRISAFLPAVDEDGSHVLVGHQLFRSHRSRVEVAIFVTVAVVLPAAVVAVALVEAWCSKHMRRCGMRHATGFLQTETCFSLVAVKGRRSQSPNLASNSSPASRANRSHSSGHAYRK